MSVPVPTFKDREQEQTFLTVHTAREVAEQALAPCGVDCASVDSRGWAD